MRGKMSKTKTNTYPHFYEQWAGFLPFPPKDCFFRNRIYTDPRSNIEWLDLAFCASGKCGKIPCQRRRDYSHDEWAREYNRLRNLENTHMRRTR